MVVTLIVGILAAMAVPMMRGRIDSAKWSEGAATTGIRVITIDGTLAGLTGTRVLDAAGDFK